MKTLCILLVATAAMTGCASTDWVHPNKPSSEFTTEYNRCMNLVRDLLHPVSIDEF